MARLLNMRPDIEVEPNLADHLNHLRKENRTDRTIRERRLTILRAARHAKRPVATFTKADVAAYQDSQQHLAPPSMHNLVVHLSRYFEWLQDHEVRPDNPSKGFVRPRNVHRSLPRPMAEDKVRRALAASEGVQPMHVWIGLGAFCGLRCMEIAKLAREDIIPGVTPYLRVVGKGRKVRIVPLPAVLLDELAGPKFPQFGYLFPRIDGKQGPSTAMRVSEQINEFLHAHGIPDTAHSLRHRFGTKLYEATGDPLVVAEVMGHASTDTTRMYVQIQPDRAARAIESISHISAA